MQFKTITLSALLVLALSWGEAEAQLQTIVTDHFRIHYTGGAQGTARRVADVAEEVFPSLAAAYDYYDDFSPIHVLVLDSSDLLGNGLADYYSNLIVIWATPLDMDLRGSHDWIKNVLTHELTHVMTLNKARKKWPFMFALFSVSRYDSNPDVSFNFPLYHLNTPTWWVEGVAQYATHQFGFDDWDTHRDMLLRMAVLEDDLHSYAELGAFGNRPGGYYAEMIYNQGYALLLYIHEQYGREKVEELTHNSGNLSFDPAIRKALGISADQLYDDWVRFLKERYGQQAAEIRSGTLFEGDPLEELNEGVLEFYPSYSPDGGKLAYITSENRDFAIPRLKIYDFETGEKKELGGYVSTRVSWTPDGEEIVFVRNKNGFNDLYIYNLETDQERRISANLRAKDPHFSPDGKRIVFVRIKDGTNNLATINLDGTGLSLLTNNNDATFYSAPRFSPDGKWILFSIFRGEDRDIALIRADSPPRLKKYGLRDRSKKEKDRKWVRKKPSSADTLAAAVEADTLVVFPDSLAFPHPDTSGFKPLVASGADERDPCWLPDGSGFVFASDRTGIFNIYQYRLENGEVEQLTNVIGGAFAPTVSPSRRVVYVGYHTSDHSLYEFERGVYRREAQVKQVALRDYQSVFKGAKLSEEFDIQGYRGRKSLLVVPLLGVGPTLIGDSFGLNQVSGGLWLSTEEMLGGQRLVLRGTAGKNLRKDTDFNTDFVLFAERRLRPMVGNNRTFNPSFYGYFRRLEIDNLLTARTTSVDTLEADEIYPVLVDRENHLMIPDAEQQHIVRVDSRSDLFKDVYKIAAAGIGVPLTRRQDFSFQYMYRNYDENWKLREYHLRQKVFVIQNGRDISASLPSEAVYVDTLYRTPEDVLVARCPSGFCVASADTMLVSPEDPQIYYEDLDYYDNHELSFGWQYRNLQPTADRTINPNGRVLSLLYRYRMPALADSLAQRTSTDGVPRNIYAPAKRRFRVNEYVGYYGEHIGLPFDNTLSLEILGAYRNIVLKPRFDPQGGLFEGRFYWPLRYYLGGRDFLSGYPYFTVWGSKMLYTRIGYKFPLIQRLNTRFFNFSFSKLYGEIFAEAGAVGNSGGFDIGALGTDDFLSDVGAELRVQLFTFYRVPMHAFFQVAHPLNRDRVARDPDEPRIDKWRYYFGFSI